MTAEEDQALESHLADPYWRLTSGELYKIATADGSGIIPFRPRPEQIEVIEFLIEAVYGEDPNRCRQGIIPKARQLGMSTTVGVFCADLILWNGNRQCSLVDKRGQDATIKLNKIVKVALDNIDEAIREHVVFEKANDSQLAVEMAGKGQSSFFASTSARGGSNDVLWLSEWGWIQFEEPKRSQEIRSGALPTAKNGVTLVETTWAGGKGGDVWELIEPTLNGQANDWRIMFFPWYLDPRNVSETSVLDDQAKEYFAKIKPRLDGIGVTLSEKQMRWWAAERRKQGIFMARENPSFLDECWSSPVKGAIYAEEIERARVEGRVGDFRPYEGALVHTSWDLGAPANTAVWYWQIVGREIRILDCDIGDFGTLTARVARMNAKGYLYGKHYLPHDAQTTERSGSNFTTELIAAGLPSPSLVTVPRCHSVWIGINHAKEMFSSLAFRMPNCEKGLDALSAYRKKVEGEGALSTSEPVHDWTSHPADAFRMMAEAHRAGLIAFKHTTAEPRPDWFGPKHKRRGAAPMKVSA